MRDNGYSRLVGLLKVVLPLAALVILSTMFLLSRSPDPDARLPYADVDIDALLADPRLTAPTYSGVTQEGDEVIFSAATAHPGAGDGQGARAADPYLRLLGAAGETQLRADHAQIDPAAQSLQLSGAVQVRSAKGYQLSSERIEMQLDRSQLQSPGPVEAQTPQGRISAQSMTLTRGETKGQEVLVFNGQVKLLYQPPSVHP